jgi:hypothetical protein
VEGENEIAQVQKALRQTHHRLFRQLIVASTKAARLNQRWLDKEMNDQREHAWIEMQGPDVGQTQRMSSLIASTKFFSSAKGSRDRSSFV